MVIFLICYIASFFCARIGYHYFAGILCLIPAVYLYYYDYQRTGNLIHLRGLFSLFWLGGQGLSCFKLSYLQTPWSVVTWLSFFLAFSGFWMSFQLLNWKASVRERSSNHSKKMELDCLLHMIVLLTIGSLAAFLLEAKILGYIPFLVRGIPHAYSEFHISGIHYFTVSCVLVPALSVLYILLDSNKNKKKRIIALFMALIALGIPILCVSRFQLIFAVLVAAATYISVRDDIKKRYLLGLFLLLLPFYLVLTIARSHDISYLNSIFEMKYQKMPIFITQPYMYIANNYDNFNCLVEQLSEYSYGYRMLFPVWALSGLKFVYPHLVNFRLYINKEEMTTLTLFYDAYYDFGIAGVLIFSCLLGLIAYQLTKRLPWFRNPVSYLFYAQVAVYMVFSFFTTWFSNPTTWFYLAATGIIWVYCNIGIKQKEREVIR